MRALALQFVVSLLVSAVAASAQMSIEAPGPEGPLVGLMVSADAPNAPVVLIIPGSGPTDRDGNSPLGIRASTYRLLAEGLAANGIASVRIDKRGMFASKAAIKNPNDVTMNAYARDVTAWVATLRGRTGQRCIWILGHSEGANVALLAGVTLPDTCGLILAAAPGRPLGIILRDQLRANPANAPIIDQAFTVIESLERGRKVDTTGMHPALLPLFRPEVQDFLISAISLDPASLLARYEGPILIVQGQQDIQVGETDARRLAGANPKARVVLISTANHVLKSVTSADRAANVATYADPNLPLAPGVIDALADFVNAHR